MKYIKTKAGEIYDIDDLYICDDLNGKPYGVKDSSWLIYKESIVKQADTIEELCDRYIVKKSHYKVYTKYQFGKLKRSHIDKLLDDHYEIFGCVWTSKGLIYAAKINEKGELCLLG